VDPINGVLIEGVDYVGKTTVALRLGELIAATGQPVSVGRCYVNRTELIEFLEGEASKSDDMITRDYYYSAALVCDLALMTLPDDYRVQDRHWLTQLGRNAFFHSGNELVPTRHLVEAHRPFARNVLLTSSSAAKVERASRRPAKSPRDRYLMAHPELHQEYELFLTGLLPPAEDWLILDTTSRSVDEVAERILAYCGPNRLAGAA
jgi:thymidylate kinase